MKLKSLKWSQPEAKPGLKDVAIIIIYSMIDFY